VNLPTRMVPDLTSRWGCRSPRSVGRADTLRRVTLAEDADAELEALYAQVPDIGCRGLCTDACGPVTGGHRELVRMRRAGYRLPSHSQAWPLIYQSGGEYRCPALTDDGKCGGYEVRPMVCRIWGASVDLICPYGCLPQEGALLTRARSQMLLEHATAAGTIAPRHTLQEWETMVAQPSAEAYFRKRVHQPVATQPTTGRPSRKEGEGP
jgi:hypothetical protein